MASTVTPSAIIPSAMVAIVSADPFGVLDRVLDPGALERGLERGTVLGLPADRRLGVRQDDADLAALASVDSDPSPSPIRRPSASG